ncbi:MAG: glycosyltransferase [Flavobacteriaceae bacterium]|nr:glycosyltransferase family 4 protein [Bacteroidia bacterium]NNL59758.1 glycosyltransferase family 4 protein [Flavobacteriaceae bacterium]RZV54397.1 MAG: glycosyltransferase [Flavobacteriaceae bacterium]
MPKVILLSQFELPYHKIGSWTTMYNYYLQNDHKIDYLVCPEPKNPFNNISYSFVKASLLAKSKRKVLNKRYLGHLQALESLISPDEKYIIQLIDNFGIVDQLDTMLKSKYDRSKFYIQFFYHGYPPYYNNLKGRPFFKNIDEMVVLTHDSYRQHKDFYTSLPCRFSVLHNGVDRKKFRLLPDNEKDKLKAEFNVQDKTVFLWCSQDRPKKGLDLTLDVWRRLYDKNKKILLWVIGANRNMDIEGVEFIGKVPHEEIHKYYQASSIYLFPSLTKEGFGLSLIEALFCGNLCIASNNGGIPEVLEKGKYGQLVERPNFIEDWLDNIEKALNRIDSYNLEIPEGKYDIKEWCKSMNSRIESAKTSLA